MGVRGLSRVHLKHDQDKIFGLTISECKKYISMDSISYTSLV